MKGRYPPPIFFFTLSAAAGVAVEDWIGIRSVSVLTVLVLSIAAAAVANFRRPVCGRAILPYLLFFLMGAFLAARTSEKIESGPVYEAALAGAKVEIIGTVEREPTNAKRGELLEVAVETVTVNGSVRPASERARVLLSPTGPHLEAGSRIAVYGKASPSGGRDPTWRRYFLHKGFSAQIDTASGRIEVIDERASRLKAIISEVREGFKRGAFGVLRRETAGLLVGVVLGDARAVDLKTQENFRATGLTHVVAASGLNVMFVIGVLWPLLRLFRAPPSAQALVLIAAIWFYAFLAEGSPSILRASIMASVVIAGWLIGRRKDPMAALSLAALVLIAVNPFSIYDIGFQLSFAATIFLILLSPIIAEKFDRLPKIVSDSVAACGAAQLGTLPIIAAHFGQLSIVSLPANLLIVPASAPALVLGIFAGCLGYLSSGLALLAYRLAGAFADFMIAGAGMFASIPAASIAVTKVGSLEVLAFYLALFVGAILFAKWQGRLSAFHLLLLVFLPMVAVVGWQAFISRPPATVEASFLDVGQGDAILFREPGGATALVDAGPDETLISRRLSARGIRKLDLAVLTHGHSDHGGGFPGVFRAANVGRLLVPPSQKSNGELEELIREARSRGIKVEVAEEGKVCRLGELSFEVLRAKRAKDENDSSVVLKMTSGDFSLLLPGDSEEEAERMLVSKGGLRSTALKVPHHGGATAADKEFLKAVSPKVSVISVGRGNRYGLPSKTAIGRLKEIGSAVFRTDLNGDVTISTDGKIMEVVAER